MSELATPPKDKTRNYVNSKTANLFLSSEYQRRSGQSLGFISIAQNPGAASTNLFRHTPLVKYLAWPLLYKAELAANTSLYAGLSNDIVLDGNECYVVPWGRVSDSMREDLLDAMKLVENGGTGRAKEVWEFCEEKTREYR